MHARCRLIVALLVAATVLGCIGDTTQPSESSSPGEPPQTAGNRTPLEEATYNTTLAWTEVRAGTRTNEVIQGANCVFLIEPPEVTFETLHVNGSWPDEAMDVRIDVENASRGYDAYWNVFPQRMNLSLPAWGIGEDALVYFTLELHPARDRTVRLDMQADVSLVFTYRGDVPTDDAFDFRDGVCE